MSTTTTAVKKTCSKCKIEKSVDDFYGNYNGSGKLYPHCKSCHGNMGRSYYLRNKEKITRRTVETRRARQLGMTVAEYRRVGEPKACDSCGAPPDGVRNGLFRRNSEDHPKAKGLAVDHDHLTGKVRGFLCSSCNMALGMMDDDPEMIRNLLEYIESHATAVV